jgi:nucleotide-binding universal stress UspA family protein
MGNEQSREIPYEEAVAHWYDTVYRPVVDIIREKGILRDFPGRTEADLYLWLTEHRAAIEDELGIEIKPSDAAIDLSNQFSPRLNKVAARLGSKLLNTFLPDSLESGPPPGIWRRESLADQGSDLPEPGRLFSDVLVPLSGRESGWMAVEQAIRFAQREKSRLHGLHVLPPVLRVESQEAQEIQAEYNRRCQASNVPGSLTLTSGEVTQNIIERARWVDLVIVKLEYPPSNQPLAALHHGFRNLIQRCPRPVMAVTKSVSPLNKALLAYDGSPKAREALFVAAYLSGHCSTSLVVMSVLEAGRVNSEVLEEARKYIEGHGLEAEFIQAEDPIDKAIYQSIDEHSCDILLMGGYGRGPLLDVVLGSTVNLILNEIAIPVLICR